MSSAMIEALDQAMRDTRGRIETTVGRLSDSYGLTVSEVAIALQYMQSRRVHPRESGGDVRHDPHVRVATSAPNVPATGR